MKFTLKNHPSLEYLSKAPQGIKLAEEDAIYSEKLSNKFFALWPAHMQEFSEHVYYVTNTFIDAIHAAKHKLKPFLKDLGTGSGTILNDGLTIHYTYEVQEGECNIFVVVFDSEGYLIAMIDKIDSNRVNMTQDDFWVTSCASIDGVEESERGGYFIGFILCLALFIKHAEVEIVDIAPNKKAKHTAGGTPQQDKNETPFNIEVLDSKWFREIRRNDPFFVKGHPRMQACGEGMKDRKLIWVEGFEKQGYHRKAKIEQQNAA